MHRHVVGGTDASTGDPSNPRLDPESQRLRFLPTLLVTACTVFAAIGSFLFGYDTGVISSTISQTAFAIKFGSNGKLQPAATGGVVASFNAGAIIGVAVVSFVADRFGRRGAIFVGALFACLGGSMQGGANVLATMVLGRIFAGIGIGLLSPTIPNYCSEVAPPRIRALLAGMQQWMIGLGIVTAQWVGYGGSEVGGAFSWRFPLAIQVAPALILAGGVYFLPESPRYLAERGYEDQARAVLARLQVGNDDDDDKSAAFVEAELRQIQQAIRAEREYQALVTWGALLRSPLMRRRVLLAGSIQLFSQTSGTNVIGYYGPMIYAALGYSVTGSLFITGLYGAFAQIFNTICMLFVDKIGRRKLLIPSMLGMGATLCIEATLNKYYDPKYSTNENALRASVAMNFVFALFFTSLGMISWIYPSELFPTAIRARGTSLSTFVNWATNLVIAQCSPIGLARMGYQYFYIFTAFNWAAAVVVYFFYPETLGLTLEEASELFGDFGDLPALHSLETPVQASALQEKS